MRLIRVNRPHGESAAEEFVDPARRGLTASRLPQTDPVQSLPWHRLPARGPQRHRGTLARLAPFVAPAALSCAFTVRMRRDVAAAAASSPWVCAGAGRAAVRLRRATGSTPASR